MSGLQALRLRLKSVRSTQKITAAMKMVSAAKMRRLQSHKPNAFQYRHALETVLRGVLRENNPDDRSVLMTGNSAVPIHLIVVVGGDKGLCGTFNAMVTKAMTQSVSLFQGTEGDTVKLLPLSLKAKEALNRWHPSLRFSLSSLGSPQDELLSLDPLTLPKVAQLVEKLLEALNTQQIGSLSFIGGHCESPLVQSVREIPLIPLPPLSSSGTSEPISSSAPPALLDFDPHRGPIVTQLVKSYFTARIYELILESKLSEQAARMTAMDNATRNATQMTKDLELIYNRTRQGIVTRELIEIISSAEVLS